LQQNEQKQLLEQTKGQEEQYQNLVKADKASISNLKSQQAAAIAAVSSKRSSTGSVVGGGGTGGYPWANLVQDSGADPWGFYYRECTSYAAWKRSQIGKEIPAWGTMGPADAKYWVSWALKFGYSVDQSPQVGDIGVYQGGSYGHVMIVEKVLDGGKVLVSEYNAGFNGMYSTSEWSISSLQFIH
jgi:surface antigen